MTVIDVLGGRGTLIVRVNAEFLRGVPGLLDKCEDLGDGDSVMEALQDLNDKEINLKYKVSKKENKSGIKPLYACAFTVL